MAAQQETASSVKNEGHEYLRPWITGGLFGLSVVGMFLAFALAWYDRDGTVYFLGFAGTAVTLMCLFGTGRPISVKDIRDITGT
jgi:hypothetical protein